MTKIYITVLSLITVVAIMVGCFIHIFNRGHFSWNIGHSKAVSDTVALSGDVDTIEVDIKYAGLTVEYGDDVHVEYNLPESYIPEIGLKNGVLSVVMSNSIRIGDSGWNDFEIKIVIPEGTELDKLDLKLDAGNIEMSDITANDVKIECDAGNIELEGIVADSFDVDVDAGNIDFRKITADTVSIKADAGNIELRNCTIDIFNADADAGNIETHDCTITRGSVSTDLGNIDLDGEIGDVETHTSLGIINVDD